MSQSTRLGNLWLSIATHVLNTLDHENLKEEYLLLTSNDGVLEVIPKRLFDEDNPQRDVMPVTTIDSKSDPVTLACEIRAVIVSTTTAAWADASMSERYSELERVRH